LLLDLSLDQLHCEVHLALLALDRNFAHRCARGNVLVLLHLYVRAACLLHVLDLAALSSDDAADTLVRDLNHFLDSTWHSTHSAHSAATAG
jgi:hypothetical protein